MTSEQPKQKFRIKQISKIVKIKTLLISILFFYFLVTTPQHSSIPIVMHLLLCYAHIPTTESQAESDFHTLWWTQQCMYIFRKTILNLPNCLQVVAINKLFSRNFCEMIGFLHHSVDCGTYGNLRFGKYFVKLTSFLKKNFKQLIWRIFSSMRVNFSFLHSALCVWHTHFGNYEILLPRFFRKNSVKSTFY